MKVCQEKTKLSLSYYFWRRWLTIHCLDFFIYAARKMHLTCSVCIFPTTTKEQWTEKKETDISGICFTKENRRKLEISSTSFVLANSW